MGYRIIVNLVDYDKLTAVQRAKLKKVLEDRKAKLQKALGEVEEGLTKLKRKPAKRKTAKRR